MSALNMTSKRVEKKATKPKGVNTAQLNSCPACGSRKLVSHQTGSIYQCHECGHGVAKKIPAEDELKKLYENEYFFGKEYFDYLADRPALEKNFNDRIKRLSYTYSKNSKIVEIGCAYGYFLALIKDKVAHHVGYDVNQDGIEYARKNLKVNAYNDNFLKVKIDPSSVDSIYMWDVIEHLPNPELFIDKSSKVLKPNGYLVLSTGDIGALLPKARKEKWRMIHPPTHLHYYTRESLNKMFGRHDLEIVSVKYKGIYRNLGSVLNQIIYNRKGKERNSSLVERFSKTVHRVGANKINIPLNTWDIMEVVAQKRVAS